MGERKVLNKYYPPDFDPKNIPKRKSIHGKQITVRVMLPMTIQCRTCGEYIYRGKKFNSKMERLENETYLGIRIFRFYVKCPNCCQEIAFRTDPQNSDYILEGGANRNFEPWKQGQILQDAINKERNVEEAGNAMQALENRTKESKDEMEQLNALEEIRDLNNRHQKLDVDAVREAITEEQHNTAMAREAKAAEEDQKAAAEAFKGRVKRLEDSGSDEEDKKPSYTSLFGEKNVFAAVDEKKAVPTKPTGMLVVVKKKKSKKKKKKKNKKKEGEKRKAEEEEESERHEKKAKKCDD